MTIMKCLKLADYAKAFDSLSCNHIKLIKLRRNSFFLFCCVIIQMFNITFSVAIVCLCHRVSLISRSSKVAPSADVVVSSWNRQNKSGHGRTFRYDVKASGRFMIVTKSLF